VVRVPEAKKDQILKIARAIDKIGDADAEYTFLDRDKFEEAMNLLRESLEFDRRNGSKFRNANLKVLELLGDPHEH
jgi:hypothetical protein